MDQNTNNNISNNNITDNSINNNMSNNNINNNNYTEAQNNTNSNINQVTNQMSQIPNNNYAFQQSQANTNANQSVNLTNPQQKKKSKAVIIISILLIIAIIGILLIILLGHKNSSSNSDNPINNDSNNQINNNQNSNSKKITSWLQTIKKTELKEPTYLYDEKFVLPITVENFAEVEKPLQPAIGVVSEATIITDISLITNSDSTLYKRDEKGIWSSETNTEWPKLYINNYSDQTITVAEAFANNWWYLQKFTSDEFENDPGEAFGLPEQSIWDINTKTSPALDQLMDTIGSPSYALITYGAIDEDGYFFYDLVWEYENYTIVIPVMEGINISKNTYSIHKLYGVEYYTKESWEYAKKDSKIISVYEF